MFDWAVLDVTDLENWYVVVGLLTAIASAIYFVWLAPKRRIANALFLENDLGRKLELENEIRRTNAQLLGGVFLLIGIIYTAEELSLSRRAENFEALSQAIKLLGSDKSQEQTGAIHILNQVAREDSGKRHAVLSILSTFVRHKTQIQLSDKFGSKSTGMTSHRQNAETEALRVSETALRAMSDIITLANSGTKCDMAPIGDLSGAILLQGRLSELNLSNLNLREVKFHDANLEGTNLSCAQLAGAEFDRAVLKETDFRQASLKDASFTDTQIYGVDFSDAIDWDDKQFEYAICGDPPPSPTSVVEACGSAKKALDFDG